MLWTFIAENFILMIIEGLAVGFLLYALMQFLKISRARRTWD